LDLFEFRPNFLNIGLLLADDSPKPYGTPKGPFKTLDYSNLINGGSLVSVLSTPFTTFLGCGLEKSCMSPWLRGVFGSTRGTFFAAMAGSPVN